MLHQETIQYAWEAKEFENHPRTTKWYLYAGIIIFILLIITILSKNYLLSFIILVGAFILIQSKHEESTSIELSEYGIRIGETLLPYDKILSFWISRSTEEKPLLILKIDRTFHPIETIPIDENLPVSQIRNFLNEFVEEIEMKEPLPRKIITKFKI